MPATHEITIMFHSDISPDELIKMVIEHCKFIESAVQMQGRDAAFLEEEVSVESWGLEGREGPAGHRLVGGSIGGCHPVGLSRRPDLQ
jgi:hypothetical protein